MKNLRLKVGPLAENNERLLDLARKMMGADFDLRVDANASWSPDNAPHNLQICSDHDVYIIEEPLGKNQDRMERLALCNRAGDFTFIADESLLTSSDLEEIYQRGTFQMLSIRLSKNGGLLRSLQLAEDADTYGISYLLACLVGETGILSALGRVAASLMKTPRYVEGSYDKHLLVENITVDDLSFSHGGRAEILRDQGIGYQISDTKLERLSNDRFMC